MRARIHTHTQYLQTHTHSQTLTHEQTHTHTHTCTHTVNEIVKRMTEIMCEILDVGICKLHVVEEGGKMVIRFCAYFFKFIHFSSYYVLLASC